MALDYSHGQNDRPTLSEGIQPLYCPVQWRDLPTTKASSFNFEQASRATWPRANEGHAYVVWNNLRGNETLCQYKHARVCVYVLSEERPLTRRPI